MAPKPRSLQPPRPSQAPCITMATEEETQMEAAAVLAAALVPAEAARRALKMRMMKKRPAQIL